MRTRSDEVRGDSTSSSNTEGGLHHDVLGRRDVDYLRADCSQRGWRKKEVLLEMLGEAAEEALQESDNELLEEGRRGGAKSQSL